MEEGQEMGIEKLGVLIAGIFVGALAAELVRKKCPKSLSGLYAKASEAAGAAAEAFKKGYKNAKRPQKAALAKA